MNRPDDLLRHKKIFDRYAAQSVHELSVYHFSSVFLWQDFFQFTFEVIGEKLCVWATHSIGTFLYLPPLGREMSIKTVEVCFRRLKSENSKKGVGRIENLTKEEASFLDPEKYKTVLKSNEYFYRREDLALLSGNAYKSKRSSYNQFVKNYRHEFLPFDHRWREDCLSLYDRWAANRAGRSDDDIYKAMLEENRGVHALMLRYFRELGLEGRVVLIDGKLRAYTFGYPLNNDVFCVLVEVVDLDFKGLSVYIFSRLCADDALGNFQLINAMDDFAMDNIARTKGSFRPSSLVGSFTATEK